MAVKIDLDQKMISISGEQFEESILDQKTKKTYSKLAYIFHRTYSSYIFHRTERF